MKNAIKISIRIAPEPLTTNHTGIRLFIGQLSKLIAPIIIIVNGYIIDINRITVITVPIITYV